ncbi:MAG: pentapeptide repeat-containing protein [Deltaproteobacteria bacterium]|nr:MAG: pentapeptide repeat-containing protein [Deltaproteobacteria bacterium]
MRSAQPLASTRHASPKALPLQATRTIPRPDPLMANPEHIAILKQGVTAWNQWREDNPDVRPDLSEAYLMGADMKGFNLAGASLYYARLDGADLAGADLTEADLRRASLVKANLKDAIALRARLNYADLSGAKLDYARFLGASLAHARMSGVVVIGTDLRGADLPARGLTTLDLLLAKVSFRLPDPPPYEDD